MSAMNEYGHRWLSNGRCWYCGMKTSTYSEIKQASREQPERQDLKDMMKCIERS